MKQILVNYKAVICSEPPSIVEHPTTVFTDEGVDVKQFDTDADFEQYLTDNNLLYLKKL
jgi:hypothetical protein